jgi:disulfide bond formation protein DsbB
MNRTKYYHELANILALIGVICILCLALFFEFYEGTLPCPLCYLQRVAFVAVGISLMMNLSIGPRPAHYGLLIFSSLLGLLIALRQVSLHLLPGDAGYGAPVFGIHLYTWSALGFVAYLLFAAFSLMFDKSFEKPKHSSLNHIIGFFLLLVIAMNLVLALLECGFMPCPDNPTSYRLLSMLL